MTTFIIISLVISALLILEDCFFNAQLKSNTPATSAQLYLDCEVDDFEDYCNYRMNNKGPRVVAIIPETKYRSAIKVFAQE